MAEAAKISRPSKKKAVVIDHVGFDKGNGAGKIYIPCQKRAVAFQSLASPADYMFDSVTSKMDCEPLMIDGQPWYAGVQPDQTSWRAPIHQGRDTTDEHLAIFLEGLSHIGADRIGCMVMGAPIAQATDDLYVQAMIKRYQATHDVRGREVTVEKVGVYAEPLGTAWAYVSEQADFPGGQTVLIADFGYGTTNIVLLRIDQTNGQIDIRIDNRTAKSLWVGASQACENISAAIKAHLGVNLPSHKVSSMFRDHGLHIQHVGVMRAGKNIAMGLYVPSVIDAHARRIENMIMTDMRDALGEVDVMLATGGFAEPMADVMKDTFPCPVEVMKDPQTANARGFATMAAIHAQNG